MLSTTETEGETTDPTSHADKAASDLQWQLLLGRVGHYAASDAARELLGALRPLPDVESATHAQVRVREALMLIRNDAALPVRNVPNVDELCARLKRGSSGTASELRDAARVIEQALSLRDHAKRHAASCPELAQLLQCAPQLGTLRDRIVVAIDEHGELMDSASPGVRNARRALAQQREQLRATSQKLLAKYKDSLSGQFVAERGGRTVLPVRADAPNRMEGLILGSSGSGSSLYIEPVELTQHNNRVHVAEAELRREEARILNELSGLAMGSVVELLDAYDNCIVADCVAAVARWADACGALPVRFGKSHQLVLRQMRHPLLIGEAQRVVPNDLLLRASQCLIVSGPNAGGKTVALKCLGLAVWMAQSGLPVPCDAQSEIGWFDEVFTDIGDEQSISRSLSTFSAHVSRLAAYLDAARPGCLVLLDEIAGGTDPDEGAALAASILATLSERGAAVAVTTHYERLKQLAAEDEGTYENASVGFDLATLRPTFELTLGIPGQSSALAVAQRYGIPAQVVERARQALPETQLEQHKLLALLEQERVQLHEKRVETETELERQRRLSEQMQRDSDKARQLEHQRLSKEARALTLEVLEARALVRKAKEQLGKARHASDAVKHAEQLVSSAASPVTVEGSLTRALENPAPSAALSEDELTVGMLVSVPHLKAQGQLLTLPSKGTVRISVGGLKMSVPVDRLCAAKPRGAAGDSPKSVTSVAGRHTVAGKRQPGAIGRPRPAAPAQGHAPTSYMNTAEQAAPDTSSYSPSRTSGNTCDLRGMRIEQGLEQIEGFIDRMLRADEPAAFFLHGHGTGAMKEAVREYLGTSPYVSRWEPAQPEDGGDALTVCWL